MNSRNRNYQNVTERGENTEKNAQCQSHWNTGNTSSSLTYKSKWKERKMQKKIFEEIMDEGFQNFRKTINWHIQGA